MKTMARKATKYESQAKTTSIRITSRASIKARDNYYTVEYCEERSIPDTADVEKERALLWEIANLECDKQVEDIWQAITKRKV